MFEFDPSKSASNRAKHGIDFEEAQALWKDKGRKEIPTRRGNDDERWVVIGSIAGRLWTAVVTYRADAIRIISVRRARSSEASLYEQRDD
jgi:uncharacterized protein